MAAAPFWGKKYSESNLFSIYSEQRFHPSTPTYQKDIIRRRNSQTFVSTVFPVKQVWDKTLAYSAETSLECPLPASHMSAPVAEGRGSSAPRSPRGQGQFGHWVAASTKDMNILTPNTLSIPVPKHLAVGSAGAHGSSCHLPALSSTG